RQVDAAGHLRQVQLQQQAGLLVALEGFLAPDPDGRIVGGMGFEGPGDALLEQLAEIKVATECSEAFRDDVKGLAVPQRLSGGDGEDARLGYRQVHATGFALPGFKVLQRHTEQGLAGQAEGFEIFHRPIPGCGQEGIGVLYPARLEQPGIAYIQVESEGALQGGLEQRFDISFRVGKGIEPGVHLPAQGQ
ncbi:hypothetical protein COLO4_01925, partial [Corchorus olitorius]